MTTEARATIKAALDLGLQAWRTTSSRERFLKAHDAVDALAAMLAKTQHALEEACQALLEDLSNRAWHEGHPEPLAEDCIVCVIDAALASGSAAEGDT